MTYTYDHRLLNQVNYYIWDTIWAPSQNGPLVVQDIAARYNGLQVAMGKNIEQDVLEQYKEKHEFDIMRQYLLSYVAGTTPPECNIIDSKKRQTPTKVNHLNVLKHRHEIATSAKSKNWAEYKSTPSKTPEVLKKVFVKKSDIDDRDLSSVLNQLFKLASKTFNLKISRGRHPTWGENVWEWILYDLSKNTYIGKIYLDLYSTQDPKYFRLKTNTSDSPFTIGAIVGNLIQCPNNPKILQTLYELFGNFCMNAMGHNILSPLMGNILWHKVHTILDIDDIIAKDYLIHSKRLLDHQYSEVIENYSISILNGESHKYCLYLISGIEKDNLAEYSKVIKDISPYIDDNP